MLLCNPWINERTRLLLPRYLMKCAKDIQKPCIPWSPHKSYTYGGQFLKLKKPKKLKIKY